MNRRDFLKTLGVMGSAVVLAPKTLRAWQSKAPENAYGCLVDLTRCIGCRKCEWGCNQEHDLGKPQVSFEDKRVFDKYRRPDQDAFTTVNRFHPGLKDEKGELKEVFAKIQCMHCQDPGCVSACVAGAIKKRETGAVVYDKTRCIGCRYCMVACAFQMPAYEYDDPIAPRVRKCSLCSERIGAEGKKPRCASICPVEAITYGRRKTLLKIAKKRIKKNPGVYVNKVYGEDEVGGTSWLYISPASFDRVGFEKLQKEPIPKLPETIQHSLFSYLWSPIVLFGALGALMYKSNKPDDKGGEN